MNAIDLFAGLGGSSTGAEKAGYNIIWAANHWPVAVEWHSVNHPNTHHECQDLHQASWEKIAAHDVMLASPCCQGHSNAKGKQKPEHDTSRSTAWAPVAAAEYHRQHVIVLENVPEFLNWQLYKPWKLCWEAMGYSVSPHIIDAANHGVAQHRVRLFLICTKSKHPIKLKMPDKESKSALDIINLNSGNWSKIDKPGRSKNTLARIKRGREKFGDLFVMPYYGSGSGLTGRDINRPLGTLTTRDRWAIVNGGDMRMLTKEEVKRGMGFPNETQLPDNHKLAVHLLGNAVSPPVITDLLNELKKVA